MGFRLKKNCFNTWLIQCQAYDYTTGVGALPNGWQTVAKVRGDINQAVAVKRALEKEEQRSENE